MIHFGRTIIVDYEILDDLSPSVILRNIEDSCDRQIRLAVGDRVNWRVFPDKYCIGYHTLEKGRSYIACPERTILSSGTQCGKCRLIDSLVPCIICTGDRCKASDDVRDHCSRSETSIYIVAFGSDLKVGVTKKDRLLKRWLEQGADEGVEVGVASNARYARIVESKISKEFSIFKSIRVKTKIENLLSQPSVATLDLLDGLTVKVSEWIREHYPECKNGERRVVRLEHFYNLSFQSAPFAFIPHNNFTISAEFLGIKGPLFFFEDNAIHFLDFRALRGRRILLNIPHSRGQLALTDWT